MGSGQSKPKVPHVVIVGGGYSGTRLAFLLKNATFCKTTLIDPGESMHHNLASARTVVEPEFAKYMFIPFNKIISNHVRQRVTTIKKEKNVVMLQNGKKVAYDYLIIASGALQDFPAKLGNKKEVAADDATSLYKNFTETMKKAHRIACIGGTIFACELAGEIKTDYPDKQVIIIHQSKNLASSHVNQEFQDALNEKLQRKDVDLMLDQNVTNLDELKFNEIVENQVVKISNSKEVEVDLIVSCGEQKIANDFCKPALGNAVLDTGAIKVDPSLKVEGCSNIFAVGYANICDVEKTLHTGQKQAELVAENLKVSIEGGEKLKEFEKDELNLIVTIGRYDGVGTFGDGKLLDEDECREHKSEDLFSKLIWNQRGLELPE